MKIRVVTDHTAPYVFFRVVVHVGSLADPPGLEGCAYLTANALLHGTASRDRAAFMEALDQLGASLEVAVFRHFVLVEGEVLTRHLDAMVDLLGEALSAPRFDEQELSKLARRTATELLQAVDHDESLASVAALGHVWGSHPYARSTKGTPASVARVTAADVRAFYSAHFVRGAVQFAAAGDIDEVRARELATRLSAGLRPARAVEPDAVPPAPSWEGLRIQIVDKPARAQVQVCFKQPTVSAPHPDSLALSLANSALGGTFTSRLVRVIREERGWSYGVHSRIVADRHLGVFSASYHPGVDDAAEALAIGRQIVRQWADSGVSAEEYDFTQSYAVNAFAFQVETAARRSSTWLEAELVGRPPDWVDTFEARVVGTTLDHANRAAREHVRPASLALTLVGSADHLRPCVEGWEGVAAIDVLPHREVWMAAEWRQERGGS